MASRSLGSANRTGRRAAVATGIDRWLQTLLEAGPATRGLAASVRGGHLILARADDLGPDPRFRLTPLGVTAYGLSLYRRKRWEALPYHGTLQELVDVMNTDLQHWAADWP